MRENTIVRFCFVDLFPLGDRMLSGPVAAPAAHQSILQRSCVMIE